MESGSIHGAEQRREGGEPVISVVLADDQPLMRASLRSLIEAEGDMHVVGEAADGQKAISVAKQTHADVVVMEIKLPVLGGIDACREIRDSPDLGMTRVLFLTTFEEDANVLRSVRAGASGFVGKTGDSGMVLDAIRIVHGGDAFLSPRATRTLLDHFVAPSNADLAPLAALTNREREVLAQVVHGRTNADIAGELAIAPLTVKTHVNRIMAKVGAHDRAQLVVFAYESGMLLPQRTPSPVAYYSTDA